MIPRILRPVRLGLVLILAGGWSTAAYADSLDKVLTGNATSILGQLAKKGYSNVGVLKFEVQTGGPDGPIAMNLGQINTSMATRLENALILANDETKPTGIIRGAGRVAVKHDGAATYRTEEGRAKLLTEKYPLAWGKQSVTPDALLVGRVSLDRDWKKTTVSLRLFDGKNPATWQALKLADAEVAVTRQTLADLGQSFTVPQLVRKRGGEREAADPFGAEEADKAAVPIVARVRPRTGEASVPEIRPDIIPPTAPPNYSGKGWDGVEELLTFKVYYDNVEVPRKGDGNYSPPKPGQKVEFTLKCTERLGLVLLVNGINTADFDKASREVGTYKKWVLEPDENYLIRGYYTNGWVYGWVYSFETARREEAVLVLSDLAPREQFGQIELHVYKEVEKGTMVARNGGLRDEAGTAETLSDLKKNIQERILASAMPVKKSLIIPGPGEAYTGKTTEFEGILAAKVVITYSPGSGSR